MKKRYCQPVVTSFEIRYTHVVCQSFGNGDNPNPVNFGDAEEENGGTADAHSRYDLWEDAYLW